MNITSWKSPSNIALVKYWGKKGLQLPANASISFVLDQAHTLSTLQWEKNSSGNALLEFTYQGQPKPAFLPKLNEFLSRLENEMPFLKEYALKLDSSNSFPHSSGIASSASAMSALALCLCDLEIAEGYANQEVSYLKRASEIARLGSGSACRSVFPGFAVWGEHPLVNGSSDRYAVEVNDHIHPLFKTFRDVVLLIDSGEKSVSSTAGHALLGSHPYAGQRYAEANQNLSRLWEILKNGDLDGFAAIVESEALQLHAMMMTSAPPFLLMQPGTVAAIQALWQYRKQNGTPVCFTLDAGANLHVLFPQHAEEEVMKFINNSLVGYCAEGRYLCNAVGPGPEKQTQP